MLSISEMKEVFKAVSELYDQGKNQEGHTKLLALKDDALLLKEENLELRGELLELRQQVQKLTKESDIRDYLTFRNSFYYIKKHEREDGPFCSRCYDADNKLLRLIHEPDYSGTHHCPECKVSYGEKRHSTISFEPDRFK